MNIATEEQIDDVAVGGFKPKSGQQKLGIIVYGETVDDAFTIAHEIKRALSKFDIDVHIDEEDNAGDAFINSKLNRKLESLSGTEIPLECVQINKTVDT